MGLPFRSREERYVFGIPADGQFLYGYLMVKIAADDAHHNHKEVLLADSTTTEARNIHGMQNEGFMTRRCSMLRVVFLRVRRSIARREATRP
jgi:hypothetical protein